MKFQARAPASGSAPTAGYRPLVDVAKSYLGALGVAVGESGAHEGDIVLIRRLALGDAEDDDRKAILEAARRGLDASHPQVLRCVDVVESDEGIAVVSEYVDGTTLGTLMRMLLARREPVPIPALIRIAVDALSAVGFLHNQPDYRGGGLSPEALHLGKDGRTRIFEPHLHAALGTLPSLADHHDRLAYQAPEVLRRSEEPTRASDLFTLGVMLWELLQKKRLFTGLSASAIREQILTTPAPALDVEGLPKAVAQVVAKALERDPEDRFEDAAAMQMALQEAAESVGIHEDVAKLFEEVLGGHPSIKRVRRAVTEETSRAQEASADDSKPGAKSKPSSPGAKPSAPGAKPVRKSGLLGKAKLPSTGRSISALPGPLKKLGDKKLRDRPPKPPTTTPRKPPKASPSKPGAPKPSAKEEGTEAEAGVAAASSTPAMDGLPKEPLPISVVPLSSEPPEADEDARARATVPAGPGHKAALEALSVPKAPPAPSLDSALGDADDEEDPSEELPAGDIDRDSIAPKETFPSVAPADSLPPPGPDELTPAGAPRQVGRCELFVEIAHGGMATVHLGRWLGAGGFVKTVAVKALHPQYARDPEFVRMFLDEARVVARIRHPNVMPIIDLVEHGGDLFIVMEYVHGVTLAHLLRQMHRRKEKIPVGIALRIMSGVLHGLNAAHEAKDAKGQPMKIIHRDISPENIMVGADGYARLIDFGIASALGRATTTQDGQVKGKPSYLAPEQVMGEKLDNRTDVYSASVVLWQALTGRKLFKADNMAAMSLKIIKGDRPAPSKLRDGITRELDAVVLRGMSVAPKDRFAEAELMAEAIDKLGGLASHREVGQWVRTVAAPRLERAQSILEAVEAAPLTAEPDEEELEGPMSVRQATGAAIPAPRQPLPSTNDLSYTDITSQASTTGMQTTTAPGVKRGVVIGGAVLGAIAVAAIISLAVGDDASEETSPSPATTAASAAPPPAPTEPPPPEPIAEPTATATASTDEAAGGAAPQASASAEASASASASAAPTTAPKVGPAPKWRPPSTTRLPSGI
jgi:serine/threonine-protein kinase